MCGTMFATRGGRMRPIPAAPVSWCFLRALGAFFVLANLSAIRWNRQRVLICSLFALMLGHLAGCRRADLASYSLSDTVLSLGEDAEDEEERAFWAGLREEIEGELRRRCGTPQQPILLGADDKQEARLLLGAQVYARRCAACHGVTGDGNGAVAQYLQPKPRDYRRGIFKFTSTAYGAKPLKADLIRTVRRGVTGTSMPSFDELTSHEIEAVVDYVLALTHRGELEEELAVLVDEEEELDVEYVGDIIEQILEQWREAGQRITTPATPMPPFTEAAVAEGHKLFLKHACNKCHGKDGRGGSLGNVDVGVDAWGHKAAAADLTSGMFRGGERPRDIYQRISAGINGTPMPSFAQQFAADPDDIWRLVHFVQDLGQRRRNGLPPIEATRILAIEEEIAAEAAQAAETVPE